MITILIVDDQNLLCEILQTSLEVEEDLQIVGRAKNGQIALEEIDRLHPDIVLIDIDMPVMDGLTATEKIVQNFPQTKVIILSGREDESSRLDAIHAGAKGYLPKTVQASDIVKQIRHVHQGGGFMESESELRKTIIQLNKAQEKIQAGMHQVQQKLNQVVETEARIKRHFDELESKQGVLSEEMFNFKSDVETSLSEIRRAAKDSNYYLAEVNRIQNLVEGQISYIKSYIKHLNKRFNFMRNYLLVSLCFTGVAMILAMTALFGNNSAG